MRYTRAAAYARANLGAIRQMLETSESAIERANLEDRIEDWEHEVADADRRAATLAEAAILFDGAPVKANVGIDTPARVKAARDRASSTQVDEALEAKLGVLQGLMQERARFELRLDDGTVIAGRVDRAVEPSTLAALYNLPVSASLRRLTISRGGRRRVDWVLLSAVVEPSEE
jgi:hypothetical protein